MKSCVSTYSYHPLYNGGFTRFDAIDKTKELGCEGVELVLDEASAPAGTSLLDYTRALADHARELGLEVPIYTTGANFFVPEPEREVERVCRHIDIAAECGIRLLRHDVAYSYGSYEGVKTYRRVIEKVAPYISQVADYGKSRGVKTCSENHGRLMQDSDRMLELFDAVNNENYGFLCDIGNFGGVDEDCSTAVSKLLDLIVYVHAKDVFTKPGMSYNPGRGYNVSRAGNYRRATIFGHGNVPTFQILKAIKNSGYDGFVSLEFEGMEPAMLGIEIGTENLQRMIKDLG